MLQHVKLTLNGSVQKLSDGIPTPDPNLTTGDALAVKNVACRQILLQAAGGNGNPIFIGGDVGGTLTSTNYGLRIAAAVTGVPDRPLLLDSFDSGSLRPSDVFVLGTSTEILYALLVNY